MISAGPRRLGKYEFHKHLANSKWGELWIGYDLQARSYVAIKVFYTTLSADSDLLAQLRQQAELIEALQLPHIIRIHDLLVFPSKNPASPVVTMVCLVTDYVEGQTLADYMQHKQGIGKIRPGAELVELFSAVSLALDHAHQVGIVHGNLKPSNILLRRGTSTAGQVGEPVLTDFGFIKLLGTNGSTSSPFYLSPEQLRGYPATEESDIYALSVMLYELCTGVLPFRGNRPVAIMMQHLTAQPTLPALMNPSVSSALTNVILRGLAKEPEKRFSSPVSMAVALARALNTPIPDSLSQVADRPDVISELGNSSEFQSSALAAVTSSVESVSPRKDSTSATRLTAARETIFSSAASERSRRRNLLSPWFLMSILALSLAAMTTIGAILLSPQKTPVVAPVQLVGHAYFLSSGQFNTSGPQGINDELQIDLSHIPAPPAGKSYFAWLLADKSVSESLPISLGALNVDHGTIHLLFHGDAQHTNLLGVTSRFLITVDDTHQPTNNPLIDTGTWRFYAEIPEKPSPLDKLHFSMLDHLRHLLVESPELSIRGLHGGLGFWFVRNTFSVLEAANSAREAWHTPNADTIRDQLIRILDYLDGAAFVQADVPHGTPLLIDARVSQVALLGPAPHTVNPPGYVYSGDVPPGYVYLISEHMGGAIESPQTTADQRALAVQINRELDREKELLDQEHQDAKRLLSMDDAQLLQAGALSLLDDLAAQGQDAYTGQNNPSTNQLEGGALGIYNSLQRLAAFDIWQYTPPQ